jgi:hypothetical protein
VTAQQSLSSPAFGSMPGPLRESILRLLRNVDWYCARRPLGVQVTTTLRRRPLDARGRTGCCIEIRLSTPPPPGGLQEIRLAGGEDAILSRHAASAELPLAAGDALTVVMGETFCGGCSILMDARWAEWPAHCR